MPKKKKTLLDILVILDRSGSMASAKSDHEGGLKTFVAEQRKVKGDALFSLIQFDSSNPCEVVYDRVPLTDVSDIVLDPRGSTPLLDAVGKSIAHITNAQRSKPSTETLVMVVTDGMENASTEWTKTALKKRITELETNDKWKFVFLGANIDAFGEASSIGIHGNVTMNFNNNNPQAVKSVYASLTSNTSSYRCMTEQGMDREVAIGGLVFTKAQAEAAEGKGN